VLPQERQVLTDQRELRLAGLRQELEERYRLHTERLTELTMLASESADGDRAAVRALIASSRRALAEIAGALRGMAEGRYGVCATCQQDIPVERLEIVPYTELCAACQRLAHR
jgi:DnaK suppressor protein